jgi:8-oxo-dGTP diphosphatase
MEGIFLIWNLIKFKPLSIEMPQEPTQTAAPKKPQKTEEVVNKKIMVGVKILLVDEARENFFAISRKDKGALAFKEAWDIPGGRIELGEEPIEALKREIKEEIGLSLNVIPQIIDASNVINNDELQVVRITYAARIDKSTSLKITLGDEHNASKWLNLYESNEFHPCLNKAIFNYNSLKSDQP